MKPDAERNDAWEALEAVLAEAELLETSPDFADRVMARMAAEPSTPAALWFSAPEVIRRPGIAAAVVWPFWLCAITLELVVSQTLEACADAWREIRQSVSMLAPAPGNNGTGV